MKSTLKAGLVALALIFGTTATATFYDAYSAPAEAAVKKVKKAKKAKKKRAGKKAKRAKKGSCGTFKYRKGGKCLDARNKVAPK